MKGPFMLAGGATLLAGALLLSGCGDRVTDPGVEAVAMETISLGPAARVTLESGDGFTRGLGQKAGALIEVIRPDTWNGDLVLLMHGAVPRNAPIALRHPLQWQTQPTIDALVARGYGVALSSYRRNGTAVVEGALDTRIAQATFTSQFGQPEATDPLGWSMGGAVGHQLVAAGAPRYAGFLSICSDQVGSTRVNEYWLDARVLFD